MRRFVWFPGTLARERATPASGVLHKVGAVSRHGAMSKGRLLKKVQMQGGAR
jgi:hypothetical protein